MKFLRKSPEELAGESSSEVGNLEKELKTKNIPKSDEEIKRFETEQEYYDAEKEWNRKRDKLIRLTNHLIDIRLHREVEQLDKENYESTFMIKRIEESLYLKYNPELKEDWISIKEAFNEKRKELDEEKRRIEERKPLILIKKEESAYIEKKEAKERQFRQTLEEMKKI